MSQIQNGTPMRRRLIGFMLFAALLAGCSDDASAPGGPLINGVTACRSSDGELCTEDRDIAPDLERSSNESCTKSDGAVSDRCSLDGAYFSCEYNYSTGDSKLLVVYTGEDEASLKGLCEGEGIFRKYR